MQTITTISKSISVSIDEVKQNLNILSGDTSNDTLINSLIDVAVDYCESIVGNIALASKRMTISSYRFGNEIVVNDSAISAITSLSIDDEEIIDFTTYIGTTYSIVKLPNAINADSITISYIAGYTNIPPRYKQAIIIKASDLFDTERSNYSYNVTANNCINRLLGIQ